MNHPELDKALLGLWISQDGLMDFLDDHAGRDEHEATGMEEDCRCVLCAEARGIQYLVRVTVQRLESRLGRCTPEMLKIRGVRLPGAYELMNAIDRLGKPQEGPEDPEEA